MNITNSNGPKAAVQSTTVYLVLHGIRVLEARQKRSSSTMNGIRGRAVGVTPEMMYYLVPKII